MPLYEYAEHHRQLIEVPLDRLRDNPNSPQHNNTDRMLALRHYLLQEVEILLYEHNRVNALQIRLLKEDAEGNEWGLLWVLGITGTSETQTVKDPSAVAKRVQKSMAALLEGWQQSGYLGSLQYQMLSAQDGFGVRMASPE